MLSYIEFELRKQLHVLYSQIYYHPNLNSFLVTELCNGTLDDLVKGRYNGAPIIRINWLIVRQIVVGLCYLHRNGVVHRDLNPRNVIFIIDDKNHPVMKLADFGMSRTLKEGQSHLTRTQVQNGYSVYTVPFGTDGWIAPEVLNGERTYKKSADIFPLGLIIAFTLSGGIHPFDVDPPNDKETNEQKIQRSMKRNERIRKGEPMTLTVDQLKEDDRLAFDLIQSMLSPNPNERPSTDQVLRHEYFRDRRSDPQVVELQMNIKKADEPIISFN